MNLDLELAMSLPRIYYEGDTFYHVVNRVGGEKSYFPFDDVVKQKFLDLMNRQSFGFSVN
jgi:hypothetical protein